MKDNKGINKGDKVCIESMYKPPYYRGRVVGEDSNGDIIIKRDDQDYTRTYNLKRITKDDKE